MLNRPHHTIGANDVHVWHLLADDVTDHGALLAIYALLTTDEQDRMARLKHEHDRNLFLLSRGLMRSVLASYLGCRPRDVQFAANNFGKPILQNAPALQFNLTHSRGAAALAVGGSREVGVDIERRERQVEYLALAQRFFTAAEAQHLLNIGEEKRSDAFFAIWTLKEAFVKAIGRGISFPLDAFCFDLDVTRLVRFRPLADFVSCDWHFHQFDLGDRHCGALAVQSPGANKVDVTMRDWRTTFFASPSQNHESQNHLTP
ncbi:MAG: 4'-phosphopantetheinyl transferase superfamily protein [Planctomycetes bacterium]|nr:4'-phosphopantetheinyl transferase superfamily protein [Planctomycetota bacterium]